MASINPEIADEQEDWLRIAMKLLSWVDCSTATNCGINFCVDLSATTYFADGQEQTNLSPDRSDFGLIDAIESGLVKIPQLAIRDTTGAEYPSYFNIWQMDSAEVDARRTRWQKGSPKPEAILKYAHHPIAMLAGLWEKEREEWLKAGN